jgi:alkanesulfonate monooxygenase SsuD/methylene tetrahydromethanopterin reductase-like flavin-dependent oxidoreductase (luciferase family)
MLIVDLDALPHEIQALRSNTHADWAGIFASGHVVCKKTQKQADDYYRYVVEEMADVESLERHLKLRVGSQSIPPDKLQLMKERLVSGTGTLPIVGDPDAVARMFKRISDAGVDGMAIGLINFIDDIPLIRDEVLPRMARLGLRKALI